MNVADLAEELGVPASAVIEQCQRFGLDASWVGAELSGSDVVVLRAELANEDGLLDLTGHGEDQEPRRAAGSVPPESVDLGKAAAGALPPTAVGSLPDLADELAAVADPAETGPAPRPPRFSGSDVAAASLASAGATPVGPGGERVARPRRRHRSLKAGLVALAIAVVLLVVSEVVANVWVTPVLWVLAVAFLVLVVVHGTRVRRQAVLHPDRMAGRWAGLALVAAGLVGLVVIGAGTWISTRSEPARSAPLALGDLRSVESARWGYQRLRLVAANGWHSPPKALGSCWTTGEEDEPRMPTRVEVGNEGTSCDDDHEVEVLAVFALDVGEPDAEYPGPAAFRDAASERCRDQVAELNEDGAEATLRVEFPTEGGWAEGDHDLACVAVTAPRDQALVGS